MKTEQVEQHEAKSNTVRRIESVFSKWGHVIEEGVDWHAALKREYWTGQQGAAEKFRPGDVVEIHSYDHYVVFEMRIKDVNVSSSPVFMQAEFLPIVPRDLELPEMPRQREPRYLVRQPKASSNFVVIDSESGTPVHDNPKTLQAARELASELERGLNASAEQLARDFIRHQAERVTGEAADEATVTPTLSAGALRTQKWRQKSRAAQSSDAA